MSRSFTERGFTLLEVMIVMVLIAVIAAIAYGGLNTQIRQHEAAAEISLEFAALQRTMALLTADLVQVQPRSVREEFHGERQGALLGGPKRDLPLELTRGGWSNPAQQRRATLQRVAWRLNGNQVERLHWRVLDRAPLLQPVVTPLVSGVAALEWRFLDESDEWHEFWPTLREFEPDHDRLPVAVELVITFQDGDTLRRVFATRAR